MEMKLVCTSWIREDDEKILTALQKSDRGLSAAELAEITGLPVRKAEHTLKLLKQQWDFSDARKAFCNEK